MEFVCDFCDNPVGINDTVCKICGANFSDVRCPSCGHKGTPKEFRGGCPHCSFEQLHLYSEKKDILSITLSVIIMLAIAVSLMILSLYRII